MSQIIKLQEGGTVNQKFFTYPSGQIEQDRLISAISTNLNKYLAQQSWSSKKQQRFLNSVDNFITGIKNGNIKEMSAIGRFEDNRGISGNGVTDTRGTKRFHEDSEAATFIKWVLDSQNPYVKPEEKPKADTTSKEDDYEFNINNELNTRLANNIFHKGIDSFNPTSDYVNLYNLNGKTPISYGTKILNTLKDITSKNYGFFNNRETYLQNIQNVQASINALNQRGQLTWENMRDNFATLGLDSSVTDTVYNYLNPPKTPEQIAAEQTTQENNNSNSSTTNNTTSTSTNSAETHPTFWTQDTENYFIDNTEQYKWNRWNYDYNANMFNEAKDKNAFFRRVLGHLKDININDPASMNVRVTSTPALSSKYALQSFPGNYTYSDVLRRSIRYLYDTKNPLITKLSDNSLVLLPSINIPKNGHASVVVLKNDGVTLKRYPLYLLYDKNTVVKKYVDTMFPKHQNGGVIKAQQGSILNNDKTTLDQLLKNYQNLLNWNTTRYRNKFDNGQITRAERNTQNIFNKNNPTTDAYDREEGGQETENQFWYSPWVNQLTNNVTLAEQWAKDYLNAFDSKDEAAQKSKAFYQTKWFGNNNTFNFDAFKNTLGSKSNLPLWSDKLNGNGHDYYTADLYRTDGGEYDTLDNLKTKGYSLSENDKPQEVGFINVHTLTKSPTLGNDSENNSSATAGTFNPAGIGYNWKPDAVLFGGSLARFWNTAAGNKKLLNEALSSLKPYLLEPKRFERNIYGDYASLSQANQNAAKINTQASQAISSDAALNASQQLQGAKAAAEEQFKGQVANEQEIKRTGELALAQAKENMSEAVDTANKNRYNIYNNNLLRSQAKQGYISRRTDNINNLLMEFQKNAYDKALRRQALDKEVLDKYINNMYVNNPQLLAMQAELEKWIKDGNTANSWPKYQEFINLNKELNNQALQLSLKYQGRLLGTGVNTRLLNGLNGMSATTIPQKKSGGSISEESKIKIAKAKHSLDRDKLFYKAVSEHTKDTSTNIRQLSAGMQKLLSQVIKPK